MQQLRRLAWFGAVCACVSVAVVASAAQKNTKDAKDKDAGDAKPQVRLKASPVISVSPSKVVLTAEIVGGANDYEEFYCPTVEWDWGDGTVSENSSDCDPYEAGKTTIQRRFSNDHVYYQSGGFRVAFRLKQKNKLMAMSTVNVQVRPGLPEGF